jgi:tryptophan synthase beta chain
MPPPIHSGGLRYHGMAPTVSHLKKLGLIEAAAVPQTKVFDSAVLFARTEGIIPAPETSHAIHVAIQEAIKAREEGKKKVIVFCFSGHGMIDLAAYDSYLDGKVKDS